MYQMNSKILDVYIVYFRTQIEFYFFMMWIKKQSLKPRLTLHGSNKWLIHLYNMSLVY